MRIVSLLPAATEIACALGLRGSLVGRSHECDFPAGVESLPALTRARVDSSLPSGRLDDEVRRVYAEATPLYVLDEGRVAAEGPPGAVLTSAEAARAFRVSVRAHALPGAAHRLYSFEEPP